MSTTEARVSFPKWVRKVFQKRRISEISVLLPAQDVRKRVKIVVVDDERDSFPTEGLQSDGYTVEWWEKLDATRLHRLERGDFDIIILDIQGIVEEGLSDTGDALGVLRRIKNVNPYQVVVAFSGKAYDLDSVPFWKQADDALRKPVTMIQCKELIDRLIHDRVSASGYWKNIQDVLERSGVPDRRIRALENKVVLADEKGQMLSVDSVRDLIGSLDSLDTVYTWVRRLIALCTLIF
jgi:DNA-binding response OmpR family regulator